jgi:hypothetical protein
VDEDDPFKSSHYEDRRKCDLKIISLRPDKGSPTSIEDII